MMAVTIRTILVALLIDIAEAYVVHRSLRDDLPQHEELKGPSGLPQGKNCTADAAGANQVCYKTGCIHTASELLKNMDTSTEPCDDFYQFACGQFRRKFIPDDKTGLSMFSVIGDELQEQLRMIVDEPVKDSDIRPIVNAKNMYKLCMNESEIERIGSTPVKQLLKKLGGWPLLEGSSWDMGSFSWLKTVYDFRKEGFSVDYLIDFAISIDSKNNSLRVIEIDQGAIAVARDYFVKGLDHPRVKAYFEYMIDISELFGADRSVAKEEMMKSLEFEMALANMSLPSEERRDPEKLYNRMTIGEMQIKFPTIPWFEYFRNILPSKIELTTEEPVIVGVPTYVTQLEQLLQHTEKRVIANYLMWRAAASTVSYLPEAFRKKQLKYITAITGSTEREARWKECSAQAARIVSLATGSLYVRKFFKENAKKKALELVNNIRLEMYDIIQNVDWMDEETRVAALEKAHAMTAHIAYPDELLDNAKLTEFYDGLEVNADGSYLDGIYNTTKWGQEYNFGRLRDPVNKTDWRTHGRPQIVNAFYSPTENSIQFPAGILQGAFFSEDRPNYMNYGAIGFVIGHEITHGFDDQGRTFDKEGNLRDWWHEETKEKYLEKAKCIIEQYGNFTDTQVNMKLNGINTQGENIADNGGIKEAYRAYVKWATANGEEARLPGLQQFTPRQLFWVSAASTWCSTYRDETLKNRITTGVHSPAEFRVIGPMSNMPEFAKDFNCPLGSKMNPLKKCTVW
ncbi:Peptidase family M13 [Nesidiocoris tenuis]|uniref:Peptidase family M13 n=1 Tax=Nesidiocoris tenuis TaxID=355587 RepID=A0ABN7BEX5_9HEMI|nr:Peptidase family M13 [Nesidiocoris tenuis]